MGVSKITPSVLEWYHNVGVVTDICSVLDSRVPTETPQEKRNSELMSKGKKVTVLRLTMVVFNPTTPLENRECIRKYLCKLTSIVDKSAKDLLGVDGLRRDNKERGDRSLYRKSLSCVFKNKGGHKCTYKFLNCIRREKDK